MASQLAYQQVAVTQPSIFREAPFIQDAATIQIKGSLLACTLNLHIMNLYFDCFFRLHCSVCLVFPFRLVLFLYLCNMNILSNGRHFCNRSFLYFKQVMAIKIFVLLLRYWLVTSSAKIMSDLFYF